MIETAIFDIDGTLVDSVDLHAQSWQAAFERFDKRVALADVCRQIGKGADQLMPVFLSSKELSDFGAELDNYRRTPPRAMICLPDMKIRPWVLYGCEHRSVKSRPR